ncbi:MAG: hypothetical protein HYU56_04730 [Candidatus Aenigmarchaeota archaeon]|nr:hypothetical protein [Candidatus Aenigmarchaeota archaeon]
MTLQAHKILKKRSFLESRRSEASPKIFFRGAIQEAFRTGGKRCLADAKRHFSARNRDTVAGYKSTQPDSPGRHNYAESIRALYRHEVLSATEKAEVYAYI